MLSLRSSKAKRLRRLYRKLGYYDARTRGIDRKAAREHAKAFAAREIRVDE